MKVLLRFEWHSPVEYLESVTLYELDKLSEERIAQMRRGHV